MLLEFKRLGVSVFLLILLIAFWGTAQAQVYTVKSGDTLYNIGRETGIPVDKIQKGSFLNRENINAGEVLLIPRAYIVKPGDTLFLISQRNGIELWELQNLNHLYSDNLTAGQIIYIPAKCPYERYTVQRGDSLFLISKAFKVDVQDLMHLNGLIGNDILPGDVLMIPKNQRGYHGDEVPSNTSGLGAYHSQEDRELLARLIHAEAEGEPYLGKVAVGAVVVNRVNSDKFPNTIVNTIYQVDERGFYQFSPVLDGRLYSVRVDEESMRAADEALSGIDPTGGALFFFNPSKISNRWLLSKAVIRRIGGHVFTM